MALTPIYGESPFIAFIGTEPGQLSLEKGHYYYDPRNSFYKDLYVSGFLPRIFKPTEDSLLAGYHIALDDVYDDPESLHERLKVYRPSSVCFNSKEALCSYLKISNPKSLTRWRGELAGEWANFNWKPLVWAVFDSSGSAARYQKKRIALLKELYDKMFKEIFWFRELEHYIYTDMQVTIRKGLYRGIEILGSTSVVYQGDHDDSSTSSNNEFFAIDHEKEFRRFYTEADLAEAIEYDLEIGERDYIADHLANCIESLDTYEFAFSRRFLDRAIKYKSPVIVRALGSRYQKLTYKQTDTAYQLLLIIKTLEHPKYETLWEMLQSDSEPDSQTASTILAEIGGYWAFKGILSLYKELGEQSYKYATPCLIQLVNRYRVANEEALTLKDERTQAEYTYDKLMPVRYRENKMRALRNRKQQNESYKLLPVDKVIEMNNLLQMVPDKYYLGVDKTQLISDLNSLIGE